MPITFNSKFFTASEFVTNKFVCYYGQYRRKACDMHGYQYAS